MAIGHVYTVQMQNQTIVADATSLSFIVRLLQRIREYGPHVAALRTDIDQWLALRQMTPEDAIRIEGQHEAADQVSTFPETRSTCRSRASPTRSER